MGKLAEYVVYVSAESVFKFLFWFEQTVGDFARDTDPTIKGAYNETVIYVNTYPVFLRLPILGLANSHTESFPMDGIVRLENLLFP